MAIGVYLNFAGTTVDQYEQVCSKMNNGQLMTRLSDWPVGGCLVHAAWQEESGALCVFDVWESPEAFHSFGEKMLPAAAEAGLPAIEPHVVPLHNFVAS
jgi:hypothetical protein